MGADAPIPPVAMNGRRPEGRPAAASITFSNQCTFSITGNTEASPCAPSPTGDWWRKRGVDHSGDKKIFR